MSCSKYQIDSATHLDLKTSYPNVSIKKLCKYKCGIRNNVYIGKTKHHLIIQQYEHLGKSIATDKPLRYSDKDATAIRRHCHSLYNFASRIEAWFVGRWKKDKKKEKDWLDQKYGLRRKGFTLVMEELEQRITAKATKVKRYDNRIKQFQDNRNFETNQERFFKNLEGKEERTKPPNAEDATAFWKGIWSTKVEHKRDAEWIDKAKEKMPSEKQNTVKTTKHNKRKLKSMPEWKGAGPGFLVRIFYNST